MNKAKDQFFTGLICLAMGFCAGFVPMWVHTVPEMDEAFYQLRACGQEPLSGVIRLYDFHDGRLIQTQPYRALSPQEESAVLKSIGGE